MTVYTITVYDVAKFYLCAESSRAMYNIIRLERCHVFSTK